MGKADLLELLLCSGANGEIKDYGGDTPMHWAPQENQLDCIKIWYECTIGYITNLFMRCLKRLKNNLP